MPQAAGVWKRWIFFSQGAKFRQEIVLMDKILDLYCGVFYPILNIRSRWICQQVNSYWSFVLVKLRSQRSTKSQPWWSWMAYHSNPDSLSDASENHKSLWFHKEDGVIWWCHKGHCLWASGSGKPGDCGCETSGTFAAEKFNHVFFLVLHTTNGRIKRCVFSSQML